MKILVFKNMLHKKGVIAILHGLKRDPSKSLGGHRIHCKLEMRKFLKITVNACEKKRRVQSGVLKALFSKR